MTAGDVTEDLKVSGYPRCTHRRARSWSRPTVVVANKSVVAGSL